MNVYQLKELPKEYQGLQLGPSELFAAIGKQHMMTIHKQRSQNTSLLPIWANVSASFSDVLGKNSTLPDVSLWASTYLVLRDNAYNILKPALEKEGEFLPISIEGEHAFIFNCLSFAVEDESLCVKKYLDGIEDGLETLYFDEDDIKDRLLFKSRLQGCQTLYATETFKTLCEEHGLHGLHFEPDLLSVF
ncbi:hypothetical protein [Photobacterium atrarenae]|uniref:Uncharacterized protein n=1 Tax=Photobacterium atrarenae TaxID=865757 RepID=A0ABY5GJU5_9GAMM|nr:hypothetical protein [Photobacterium atrarenae]UTV29385.1 hypothetical protein NNL38_20380 [Photobacterium atrarenae]